MADFKAIKADFEKAVASDDFKSLSAFEQLEFKLKFETFGCLDSIAFSYREMLKLQQAKAQTQPWSGRVQDPNEPSPAEAAAAEAARTFKPRPFNARKAGVKL